MVDDIADLPHVGEEDVLLCLARRFSQTQPYTMCRRVCISVNPYEWADDLYSDAQKQAYSNESSGSSAHIYKVVRCALQEMAQDEQTIVITGESGTGKTEVARLCLDFVAHQMLDRSRIDRTISTQPVLEYMGNAQTTSNPNSSRFGKLVSLRIDKAGQVSTRIETYMLEKVRAVCFGKGEGTFRVMHAVLHDDATRVEYALMGINAEVLGKTREDSPLEIFKAAAHLVGVDVQPIVRCAIVVLFLRLRDYANAAKVLGLSSAELTHAIAYRKTTVGTETIWSECSSEEQRKRVTSLIMTLYDRRFRHTVHQINAHLDDNDSSASAVFRLLDIFGFERLADNGLDQLCINYCNERIQALFVDEIIVTQQLEFANEDIEVPHVAYDTNARVIELYDNVLFPLLEEARRLSQPADSFVEAVNRQRPAGFAVPLVRQTGVVFSVDHYAGSVCYDAADFNERNADELRPEIVDMMGASVERDLFPPSDSHCRIHSVTTEFQRQMRKMTSTIRAAQYIRCIRPNDKQVPGLFDDAIVRDQLVSTGILQACQVMRLAHKLRMTHAQFRRQYGCAVPAKPVEGLLRGKTLVYLTSVAARQFERQKAQKTLENGMRTWIRRRSGVLKLQSYARGWLTRRTNARRLASAVCLQRATRRCRNRFAGTYRTLDEIDQLREQVRRLTEEMRVKDAWIFRANILLKKYVHNATHFSFEHQVT